MSENDVKDDDTQDMTETPAASAQPDGDPGTPAEPAKVAEDATE